MQIHTYADYNQMSMAAASLVIEQVNQKPASLICFPSGDSPAGMFSLLVEDAQQGEVDFSECYFVGLDEWVGMGKDDDGSCTNFLTENFFKPANIQPDKIKFFDALSTDLDGSCAAMNTFIWEQGPLDLMIVGIGINGHIGLNEPGANFDSYAHHSPLQEVTINVGQKYFKQQTPLTKGITLGLRHLREAKIPVLIASGSKKAKIVAQALKGEITNQLPASIFQTLPSAVVFLDEGAASLLDATTHVK